jgi:hypothetical protein
MSPGPVLRDIHLPTEPSWWPPAPGWWLLAALLCFALAWAWRVFAHGRRLRRLRRALHGQLDALRREQVDGAAQVAAMSLLLRRAAKRYAPQALALRDEAWLRFLDADDPARPFSQGPGRLLLDGPYRPRVDPVEAETLAALVARRLDVFVAPARRREPRGLPITPRPSDTHVRANDKPAEESS